MRRKLIFNNQSSKTQMEPIIEFDLGDVICKSALNTRGRRRFGTLEDLLQTNIWIQSTVGTGDGNVLLPDIRKSKHFRTVLEFAMNIIEVELNLKRLVPYDKQKFVRWFDKDKIFDVIEYLPGGFFKEHVDCRQHLRHYATILIFPPAVGSFAHTGGELRITRPDGTYYIFDSSKNTKWTAVAFHLGLKHECNPVLSGRRVVIKNELYYSRLTLEAEADLVRQRRNEIVPMPPVLDRRRSPSPVYYDGNLPIMHDD